LYAINLSTALKGALPSEANNKVLLPALHSHDNQVILAATTNRLQPDPANGAEKWRFAEATDTFVASPLSIETGIFAPSSDNFLYALSPTGNFNWKFETDEDQWSTPVTDGKTIFLASMDHHLHAVDIETGSKVWESEALGDPSRVAGAQPMVLSSAQLPKKCC
jgi:outer membrane protein assembly factor BamB